MLGLRHIRRKIRSAGKIEQITKTMQMVAASRFRRCEESLARVRPYMQRLEDVLRRTTHGLAPEAHPLLRPRQGGQSRLPTLTPSRVALVLVTSDRGLCGAYNANLLTQAARFVLEAAPARLTYVFVGRRGYEAYKRRGVDHLIPPANLGGRPDLPEAKKIAARLIEAFLAAEIDAAYLLSTAYLRAFAFKPALIKLLPVTPSSLTLSPSPREGEGWGEGKGSGEAADYLFEPARRDVLEFLLPHYVEMKVYTAFAEALTSENSARMMAMRNATENAGEMIDRFTLMRNKARQAAITKEIAEIVTAAEALA